ncbi:cell division protein FtsQ/DivIB [Aureisphaera galaxeae]|uniref:cell division protein FtsQ/DivIB n=1 Tax=Aureisphaera galaxeae TaxID=1538023 RepID=UPI002350E34E|nr:cell division protein FtsQ/DivIB [Aureisphaera galaxeae]MDC8003207.1 cell division protein FtsQ/DivIB [Aureisphaera galaxeae]
MKGRWSVIRLVIVLVLVGLLYGFTYTRNQGRKLTGLDVHFTDENSPFITLSAVNKLLIQNEDSVTSITKETLVLKEMESRLLQNPMVRDAQVFVTADGRLGAKIEQRNPIARVADNPSYYVDEDGKRMPLSKVYAARVPIITGSSNDNFTELTPLLLKIREDDFMNKSIVGIHKGRSGIIDLEMRKMDFNVRLGKIEDVERKFQNFKAFYQKAKRDDKLTSYRLVDLQFGSQVVATKK